MASEFTLDPVSGIPNPPTDESMILEWAAELTRSLQKDHVANVDRTETQVMMGYGESKRPPTTGSRRFFFNSISGTLSLDAEISPSFSEWVNINNVPTYQPDGLGVNVILSTSLPFTTPGTTGYFSWDEEVWDEADYWAGGSPTVVTIPEAGVYGVRFEVTLTGLGSGGGFLTEIDGALSNVADQVAMITSDGAGETYDIVISYKREFGEGAELKIYWDLSDTIDISEAALIVTPLTSAVGSLGAQPMLTDHGELSGLGDDDHALYLLASDATNRATFASYWTDLTDGGDTTLHSHAADDGDLCLAAASAYQIKDGGGTCRDMVSFAGGVMYFGTTSYSAYLRGSIVNVDSAAHTTIDSTTFTTIRSDGYVNVGAYGTNADVGITATGDIILTADAVKMPNNDPFQMRVTGGVYKTAFKMNTSNVLEIGDGAYANNTEFVTTGAVIMSDVSRLRLPYLSGIPSSPANGDIWMESDGLHIYYGGAGGEKIVAGV